MRYASVFLAIEFLMICGCQKTGGPVESQPPFRSMEQLRPSAPEAETIATVRPVRPTVTTEQLKEPSLPKTDAKESAEPKKYTVVKNDSLWSIASKHLGSGKRWREIQAANTGMDPTKLLPGQVIIVPAK